MSTLVLTIFILVFLGMVLGGLPFLKIDRTGIVLLGAIALLGSDAISFDEAQKSINLPTLILLFSFMVISAQMKLGGFYDWIIARLTASRVKPTMLLGFVIMGAAVLAAIFSNDVVCLAVTPLLIDICDEKDLSPFPFLLGLACAANIGSASTIIGNPQNMLIGQMLQLPFLAYFLLALPPVVLSLAVTWCYLVFVNKGQWHLERITTFSRDATPMRSQPQYSFDRWQITKGLLVAFVLFVLFIARIWPMEQVALVGAGILLMSRRFSTEHTLARVDWNVLILFICLFIINGAFYRTGYADKIMGYIAQTGMQLNHPFTLTGVVFVLSNTISNVPAVMLLLPQLDQKTSGIILALVSTFAGNLLIFSSISNIFMVEEAAKKGLKISWRQHARVGVPITFITLSICLLYFMLLPWVLGYAPKI